jgi:hypothetical protein
MSGNDELLARLNLMSEDMTKYSYSIGHYWNVVDECAELIRSQDAEIARLRDLARVSRVRPILEWLAKLPAMLRFMADEIDADLKKGNL